MKVAMVTSFPGGAQDDVGGVVSVSKYLADEFLKIPGIELTVVVPQGTSGSGTVCEKRGGIFVYRLPRRGFWKFLPGTVYDVVAGRRQVKSFLRKIEPDIVHFQGATFLAADCEMSSVLTILGIAEKDAAWDTRWGALRGLQCLLLKLTEDYGRRRTAHVILNSDYLGRALPSIKSRKIWRINNPVADSFFDIDRDAEPGRIFCCSRLTPLKNIAGLIEAFGVVLRRAPHSRLRIAGSGEPEYSEACRKLAETAGFASRVHFLGALSPVEVRRELSKAHCFAHPTFQEASGLAVAEAMAAGVPVVAAKVGGIPEMVEHGCTGLLVDPRDARDIGGALGRIIADDALARSMGKRGREVIREKFLASVVARKTVEVYREILGARGSPEAA